MEVPVCVDVCPTEALALIELDDYDEFIGRKRAIAVSELDGKTRPKGALLLDLAGTDEQLI
jgi:Fe-S-cluster-containing dehydrogenase component